MDWYIGKLINIERDPVDNPGDEVTVLAADFGNGLEEYTVRGSIMHAHRTAEMDVLVGMPVGRAPPGDWTAQTVVQAQAHFTTVKGRAPTAAEVS